MPYEEVTGKITSAIDDFFRYRINRPEILNRIGKNIIVFDFIRLDTAEKILAMVGRGVGNILEDVLINPLSWALFENPTGQDGKMTVNEIIQTPSGWELSVNVS